MPRWNNWSGRLEGRPKEVRFIRTEEDAAASVIAKVTRDRIMADLARRYPGYGWERNAGYGTAEHLAALQTLGATPAHRKSFAPVRNALGKDTWQ